MLGSMTKPHSVTKPPACATPGYSDNSILLHFLCCPASAVSRGVRGCSKWDEVQGLWVGIVTPASWFHSRKGFPTFCDTALASACGQLPNPSLQRDVIGNNHSGHLIGRSCLPEKEWSQEFAITRCFPPGACDPIVRHERPFPKAQAAGRGIAGWCIRPS